MASGRLAIAATAVLVGTLGTVGCSASRGESGPTSVVADGASPGAADSAQRHAGRIGAPGIGDPDFPTDGNGGRS